ncbi:ParB/RepB/Spo0J family partition protein [Caedibacter taeniospiralis]|uniref:ParB/RepB/Spo0J family partition protein n=1 Tax=Caedibacter taeniospiralis TaxID=28907 RepID=UPI000C27DFC9|nr:ParB/RepB/Spo0J family partition protein [Caedibacter taeniospiralis]
MNAKVSLANRKRVHELGSQDGSAESKKETLLALKLDALNQDATQSGRLLALSLADLLPDPSQPRKVFKNIDMLAQSIVERGIIQPIIVTPKKGDGFYHIIAGERRFRAAKQLRLTSIPCIVRDEADNDILIIQLLENEQREKVSPFEEADALTELVMKRKMNKADVAHSLGRDPSWVSLRLKLAKSSAAIRALTDDGFIEDVRTLYELKKLEDELPQLANQFIQRVRENKVHGSYRQAITRAKETWQKKEDQSIRETFVGIDEILNLDDGLIGFKTNKEHGSKLYTFKLSKAALLQLKEMI